MKKLIIILLALTIINCENPFEVNSINPPSWIIGIWSDAYNFNEFIFSSDGIIYNTSIASIDFKEMYDVIIENVNSTTEYKFSITSNDKNVYYRFVKLSAKSLNFYMIYEGATIGPAVLNKK